MPEIVRRAVLFESQQQHEEERCGLRGGTAYSVGTLSLCACLMSFMQPYAVGSHYSTLLEPTETAIEGHHIMSAY